MGCSSSVDYQCKRCEHIYDPEKDGDGKDFESWTGCCQLAFGSPWKCPGCGDSILSYESVEPVHTAEHDTTPAEAEDTEGAPSEAKAEHTEGAPSEAKDSTKVMPFSCQGENEVKGGNVTISDKPRFLDKASLKADAPEEAWSYSLDDDDLFG